MSMCDCNQGRLPCTCKGEAAHGLQASAVKQRIDEQVQQPASGDNERNPIYEGQFDGETPGQAAHRLHWAKVALAMGRDVAAAQHARDSAELRRLCAERDHLRAELAALKAQPGGVMPALSAAEREDLMEFHEAVCCDAGHRVEKAGMKRLAEIGAVESVGFGKHRLTEFGVYLLGLNHQPASGGDDAEEAFEEYAKPLGFDLTVPRSGDYMAAQTVLAWEGFKAGAAWMARAGSAGVVDERAAFKKAVHAQTEHKLSSDFLNGAEWAWKARAALAQSERVPEALHEAVIYLDLSQMNSIASGSKLHMAMRDAIESAPSPSKQGGV